MITLLLALRLSSIYYCGDPLRQTCTIHNFPCIWARWVNFPANIRDFQGGWADNCQSVGTCSPPSHTFLGIGWGDDWVGIAIASSDRSWRCPLKFRGRERLGRRAAPSVGGRSDERGPPFSFLCGSCSSSLLTFANSKFNQPYKPSFRTTTVKTSRKVKWSEHVQSI